MAQASPLTKAKVTPAVAAMLPEVISYRRHFHQHPELSLREFETAEFIEKELHRLKLKTKRLAGTGVVSVLRSGKPGPTIMLRADMDALPVTEENTHSYRSLHDGRMHACGHDSHMAMLLGMAKLLAAQGVPRGRVKLCFQPGEEGTDGGGKMVAAGVLEDPDVDFAFAMHVWVPLPIGKIAVIPGPAMAAVDEFEVKVIGKGGHAAYPHSATDPVLAAASVIQNLQSVVSRNVAPWHLAVVTVASVEAGTAFNIIPPVATMKGTVRTFDKPVRRLIERRFKSIVRQTASAMGCGTEINYIPMLPATVNNPKMAEFVREVVRGLVGRRGLVDVPPTMGGEDFSRYAEKVPAVMAFVGAQNKRKGAAYPHHHPKFEIDEDAMRLGLELAWRVTHGYLEGV